MATAQQIQSVESIIGRAFLDRALLATALTAAHRSDTGSSSEGNRRLALLGESQIGTILYDAWVQGDGTRANVIRTKDALLSKGNLAKIAVRSGLADYIQASPRQHLIRPPPPKVLAVAIKAIVGATFTDSGESLTVTSLVWEFLADFGDVILPAKIVSKSQREPFEDMVEMMRDGSPSGLDFGADADNQVNVWDLPDLFNFNTTDPSSDASTGDWTDLGKLDLASFIDAGTTSRFDEYGVITAFDSGAMLKLPSQPQEEATLDPVMPRKRKRSPGPEAGKSKKSRITAVDGIEEAQYADTRANERHEEYIRDQIQKYDLLGPPNAEEARYLQCADLRISHFKLESCADIVRSYLHLPISSSAILYIRDVLNSFRDPSTSGQTVFHVQTSAQRYNMIEGIHRQISYLDFVRRYQIWRLYMDCRTPQAAALESGFVVLTADQFKKRETRLGNPKSLTLSAVTEAMLADVFPDFEQKSNLDQKAHRRRMKDLAKLGRRLEMLKERFGTGILALLPTTINAYGFTMSDERLLGLQDSEFKRLVELLSDPIMPLATFSAAASTVVDSIFSGDPNQSKRFLLEDVAVEEIVTWPSGSPQLLKYLGAVIPPW